MLNVLIHVHFVTPKYSRNPYLYNHLYMGKTILILTLVFTIRDHVYVHRFMLWCTLIL